MTDFPETEVLIDRLDALSAGTTVDVTYESSRSDEPVARRGVVRDVGEYALYVHTDEMKGDIVVKQGGTWPPSYRPLARSTLGPFGHGAALGDLLDVKEADDG